MLSCPFCKHEYDNEKLAEDRCPQCGGIVNWSSDEQDDVEFTPMVTVSLGPKFLKKQIPKGIEKKRGSNPEQNNDNGPKQPANDRSISSAPPARDGNKNQTSLVSPNQKDTHGETQESSIQDGDPKIVGNLRPRGNPHSESTNPADQSLSDSESLDSHPAYQKTLSSQDVAKLGGIWNAASQKTSPNDETFRSTGAEDPNSADVFISERSISSGKRSETDSADYRIIRQLGKGGVGIVYSAQQNSVKRNVALKMLNVGASANKDQKEKFLFEAIVTGDLDHPNIVPIHELGKNEDGDLFYSMKQVKGKTWSDSIKELSISQNLEILLKICDAISFAHDRQIVHRDLKPENTMLGEYGEVLVVDWGIALPTSEYSTMSQLLPTPGIAGTPAYMAPEMATGPLSLIGPHSDVYLLGAILFEMITGKPPHRGKSIYDCIKNAAENVIIPTEETGELIEIAYAAMDSNLTRRIESAKSFKLALQQYQSHLESITLSDRANQGLQTAIASGEYADYSRASFAFQESIDLWDGNVAAKMGLVDTNLHYAKTALKKNDFELGLSLIDTSEEAYVPIEKTLRSGLRKQQRRTARSRLLIKVIVGLVTAGIFAGALAYHQLSSSKQLVEQSAADAKVSANKAKKSAAEAKENLKVAKASEAATYEANDKLTLQRNETEMVSNRLAVNSYFAKVGSTKDKVRERAFTNARVLVNQVADDEMEKGLALTHWEWGRLKQLCESNDRKAIKEILENVSIDDRLINAIAVSGDQRFLAAGTTSGRCRLYDTETQAVKKIDFRGSKKNFSIRCLQFSDSNLLGAGGAVDNLGWLAVCHDLTGNLSPIIRLDAHSATVNCIAFVPAKDEILTASEDRTLRQWNYAVSPDNQNSKIWAAARPAYEGHLDGVTHCDITADGKRFASSSRDGSVLIWSMEQPQPDFRFFGHYEPVFCVKFAPPSKATNPDQIFLASAGADRTILYWNYQNSCQKWGDLGAEIEKRLQSKREPQSDTSKIRNANIPTNSWIPKGAEIRLIGQHENTIRSIDFSRPSGKFIVSAAEDNLVKIWDLAAEAIQPKPRRILSGHGSWVRAAVFAGTEIKTRLEHKGFHPDLNDDSTRLEPPKTVYSAGYDKESVFQWELSKPPPTSEFTVGGAITSSDLSPDGSTIATAIKDEAIGLYDLATSKQLGQLQEGHQFLCNNILINTDKTEMLSAAGDGTVIQWDFAKGTQIRKWSGMGRRGVIAWSEKSKLIGIAKPPVRQNPSSEEMTGPRIDIYKWTSPGQIETQNQYQANPIYTLVPPLADLQKQKQLFDFVAASFISDGKFVVAGDSFGRCFFWRLDFQNEKSEFLGWLQSHRKSIVGIHQLRTSGGDNPKTQFITAGREGRISQWTVEKSAAIKLVSDNAEIKKLAGGFQVKEKLIAFDRGYPLTQISLNKNQDQILTIKQVHEEEASKSNPLEMVRNTKSEVQIINRMDGTVTALLTKEIVTIRYASFDDQKEAVLLVKEAGDEMVHLYDWNYKTQSEPAPNPWFASKASVTLLRPLPDAGDQLIMAVGKGIQIRNRHSGDLIRKFRKHALVNSMLFSNDGKQLITGGTDRLVKVWNLSTKKSEATLQHPKLGPISAIALNNRSKSIFAADNDGQIFEWKWDESKSAFSAPTQFIDPLKTGVNQLLISPNSSVLVAALQNGEVRIWDSSTGTQVVTLPAQDDSDSIHAVVFSPDMSMLATGCSDNKAYVWQTDRLKSLTGHPVPILELDGHAAPVISLKFSNDRLRLVTASEDGTAKVWNIEPSMSNEKSTTRTANPDSVPSRTRYTLSSDQKKLQAIYFRSPGTDLITTNNEGSVIVYRGNPIIPKIRLTKLIATYREVSEYLLDPSAILVDPQKTDLTDAVLLVELLTDDADPR
ncbi:MAG: protein kinase, partial [Pirellulaceae bacterium]|nr:protein kinase [Pirellulaceae bacterium]